jgi:hypothetical protein
MDKRTMAGMIRRNCHLILEGDESISDLHSAILYLHQHTYDKCYNLDLGPETFMDSLVPDTTKLILRARTRKVTDVKIDKRL